MKNLFPHHGYIWKYGVFPQTWEDPNHSEPETNTKRDSDPIDVCEIGSKINKRGAVIQVKVLGVMCLIDEGETNWTVLAIDINDHLASDINDVEDIYYIVLWYHYITKHVLFHISITCDILKATI